MIKYYRQFSWSHWQTVLNIISKVIRQCHWNGLLKFFFLWFRTQMNLNDFGWFLFYFFLIWNVSNNMGEINENFEEKFLSILQHFSANCSKCVFKMKHSIFMCKTYKIWTPISKRISENESKMNRTKCNTCALMTLCVFLLKTPNFHH